MVSELFFYQLVLIALLWLYCMLHWVWPSDGGATSPTPSQPTPPLRRRSREPQPFPGLIHQPYCAACAQAAQAPEALPPPAPLQVISRRGRPREVDTSQQFCPHANCDYRGGVDWGNLRANGHPSGGPWRQFYCTACEGYFLETHGTPLHGTRVAPDLLVWAVGALAEGLGIRAVARGFEVDPNTVLQWLVEVADHATAFSRYFLHDVRVTQVQLDELFALLSAVKAGEVSEAEASQRLSRSPQWVWTALDPVTKLLLTINVGDRTLAMAQSVVHQVVQGLAPGLCAPLPHRWLQGVHDGAADALWPVGPACALAGPRPYAETALGATPRAALGAGGQDRAAPPSGPRAAPRRIWHPGSRPTGAGGVRLADQHGLYRAPQPVDAPACGCYWTARHHALQTRGRLTPAVGGVPCLL